MKASILQENLDRVLLLAKPFSSSGGYMPSTRLVRLTAAEG